jgi:polyphosphate glucokinase
LLASWHSRIVSKLATAAGRFDRVSVGFPGVTKNGVIYTAANLGKGWNNFALGQRLRRALRRPVRVANDADVQGLGAVSGRGVELVITLGTGVGSVIFVDGHRIHLELGASSVPQWQDLRGRTGPSDVAQEG